MHNKRETYHGINTLFILEITIYTNIQSRENKVSYSSCNNLDLIDCLKSFTFVQSLRDGSREFLKRKVL